MCDVWKWEAGAVDIMEHELFDVVKRSGGLLCKCLRDIFEDYQ